MIKKIIPFTILLLLIMMLVPTSNLTAQEEDIILIYAMPYDFEEYSAYTASSYATVQWQSATLAGLYARSVNKNRDYGPVLADGEPTVEFVGNEMVITVSIKSGLKFYNGEDLTASDIVFSYKLLLTATIDSNSWGYYATYFDSNDSIVAVDDLTVEFTINQKYAFYKGLISGPIIPKDYYSPLYDAGTYDFNNPSGVDANGAGPFIVESIDTTYMKVLVRKNPYWHGSDPKVDKILFKKIDTRESAKSELAAGNIHILDGHYVTAKTAFVDMDNVREVFIGDPSTHEMSFNFNNDFLNGAATPLGISDPTQIDEAGKYVRKAISHIVPRQTIVNEIMDGLAIRANMLMPNVAQGWAGYDTHPVREYSVDIAKGLMEDAGFVYGTDVDLTADITESNSLFSVYILSPNTSPVRNQWAALIEQELPKIGVHVAQHLSTSWGVIAALTFGCATPPPPGAPGEDEFSLGGWDLFFVGLSWDLDYDPTGLFDSNSIRPYGDNWYSFHGDTAALDGVVWDDLLTSYTAEPDFNARMAKVKLLQDFFYEWEPTAAIIYTQTHWGFHENLSGIDWVLFSEGFLQWEYVNLEGIDIPTETTDSTSSTETTDPISSTETLPSPIVIMPLMIVLGSLILPIIFRKRSCQ
ncbi:MAG: ABC transporter substrate-binding protein [Candidatus Kariarchaeaceae archaeon]